MTGQSKFTTIGFGLSLGLICCAVLYAFHSDILVATICAPPFFMLQMLSCFVPGKIVFNDIAFVFEMSFLEAALLLLHELLRDRKNRHGDSWSARLLLFGFSVVIVFMFTSVCFSDGYSMGVFKWGKFGVSNAHANRNSFEITCCTCLAKELLLSSTIVFAISRMLTAIKKTIASRRR